MAWASGGGVALHTAWQFSWQPEIIIISISIIMTKMILVCDVGSESLENIPVTILSAPLFVVSIVFTSQNEYCLDRWGLQ